MQIAYDYITERFSSVTPWWNYKFVNIIVLNSFTLQRMQIADFCQNAIYTVYLGWWVIIYSTSKLSILHENWLICPIIIRFKIVTWQIIYWLSVFNNWKTLYMSLFSGNHVQIIYIGQGVFWQLELESAHEVNLRKTKACKVAFWDCKTREGAPINMCLTWRPKIDSFFNRVYQN